MRICLAYAHQWIYRIWGGGWSGKQLGGMVWERIGYFGRLYTPATNHSLECLKVSFLISTIHGCSQIWRNHHGSNSQSSTYQGSITLVLTIYVAEPAVRDAPIVSCVVASMWRDKWLQVVTFRRVREETDRDQQLIKLRESSDDRTGGMPEGLKIYKRYRDRLSVLVWCTIEVWWSQRL